MSINYKNLLITKDNARHGITSMLLCTFWFSLLYVAVKRLGATYNVYQISFFRCLFALVIALGMVVQMGGIRSLKTHRFRGHFLRATCGTISMLTLFSAYHLLPMTDVVAISFSSPLIITLLSIILLHEKVNWQQWLALIAGFIGILIVVSPSGDARNWVGVAVAFASTITRALSMTGIRSLGKTEPASTTAFYFALQSTLFTALPMPWVWQTPGWLDFLILASCGIFAGLGQYFLTRAYQFAPAAVVSPFDYTAILWAALFGFAFWHEVPGTKVIIGSVIVIAAGIFILYREKRLSQQEASAALPGPNP